MNIAPDWSETIRTGNLRPIRSRACCSVNNTCSERSSSAETSGSACGCGVPFFHRPAAEEFGENFFVCLFVCLTTFFLQLLVYEDKKRRCGHATCTELTCEFKLLSYRHVTHITTASTARASRCPHMPEVLSEYFVLSNCLHILKPLPTLL